MVMHFEGKKRDNHDEMDNIFFTLRAPSLLHPLWAVFLIERTHQPKIDVCMFCLKTVNNTPITKLHTYFFLSIIIVHYFLLLFFYLLE